MSASVPASVIPWRSASNVDRWMVGPSASGSLNGTPTSRMSPTSSAARRAARLTSLEGKPAVRYGISAVRRRALSSAQAGASRDSDKVVADREAVPGRVGDLDDGAAIGAPFILLGQADQRARRRDHAAVHVDGDAHHRTVELLAFGVRGGDDADLEGIENDAGADGIDADQIDERL